MCTYLLHTDPFAEKNPPHQCYLRVNYTSTEHKHTRQQPTARLSIRSHDVDVAMIQHAVGGKYE